MNGFLSGALAGAAGTTALNATTYADMAVRGRGASSTPQQLIEKSADLAGVPIPGKGDERENRVEGLAPLAGTAVGVVVGSVAGFVHRQLAERGRSMPAVLEIVLISGAAMAMSDVPLTLLGISDPATWQAKDWAGDVIPHLVYGAVTYAGLQAASS